jgi:predicted amidohydrolase
VPTLRLALANLRFPATREESVALTAQAIEQAAASRAHIVCFPECFVPGYRAAGKGVLPPDPAFLERARTAIVTAAGRAGVAVVLGTERVVDGMPVASALVVNADGSVAGFQNKVQIDPSEEGTYAPAPGAASSGPGR